MKLNRTVVVGLLLLLRPLACTPAVQQLKGEDDDDFFSEEGVQGGSLTSVGLCLPANCCSRANTVETPHVAARIEQRTAEAAPANRLNCLRLLSFTPTQNNVEAQKGGSQQSSALTP